MFSTVNILARAFFALGDTKTPMKFSIVCLTINFRRHAAVPLREGGPGIVNTLTSGLNVGLLLFALRKKLGKLKLESLRKNLPPLALDHFCRTGRMGKLAVVGKFHWSREHCVENRRGIRAGRSRWIGLLAAGAGVQNSGGKGNDGICAGAIQAVGCASACAP